MAGVGLELDHRGQALLRLGAHVLLVLRPRLGLGHRLAPLGIAALSRRPDLLDPRVGLGLDALGCLLGLLADGLDPALGFGAVALCGVASVGKRLLVGLALLREAGLEVGRASALLLQRGFPFHHGLAQVGELRLGALHARGELVALGPQRGELLLELLVAGVLLVGTAASIRDGLLRLGDLARGARLDLLLRLLSGGLACSAAA